MPLEFYQSPMSVCCQKVQLVLAEKGLEPEFHNLNLREGEAGQPEYLKLNPNGVVPTLVVDGRPQIESTVICEFLDEAYPEPPLTPADPFERADMRRWMLLPDAKLHEACFMLTFAIAVPAEAARPQIEAQRDPSRRERLEALVTRRFDYPPVAEKARIYDGVLEVMAKRLTSHDWLAGDAYSLADISLIPYVLRLEGLGQSWLWRERAGRARVQEWLERCQARPNFEGVRRWSDGQRGGPPADRVAEARAQIERILAA